MKRLVLLGEGHGEVAALPVLINRLLQDKGGEGVLRLDWNVIRDSPSRLVKWDKVGKQPVCKDWTDRILIAAKRPETAAVLAVFDGDFKSFPPGSGTPFCAATAAKVMAEAAKAAGAGQLFSLAVVFAVSEYETWLIAGAESFTGIALKDGRVVLPSTVKLPDGDHECRGKGWLEKHGSGYRPTRDQAALTGMLDFKHVRAKKLRSFGRLENALDQLTQAVANGRHISTPV